MAFSVTKLGLEHDRRCNGFRPERLLLDFEIAEKVYSYLELIIFICLSGMSLCLIEKKIIDLPAGHIMIGDGNAQKQCSKIHDRMGNRKSCFLNYLVWKEATVW